MSVLKSYDEDEIVALLPNCDETSGNIVRHIADVTSVGAVIAIDSRHDSFSQKRLVTVLWTKEPRVSTIHTQYIKNKPKPTRSNWKIEAAEDSVSMGSLDGRHQFSLRNMPRLVSEETFDKRDIDDAFMKEMYQEGANIEYHMDGDVVIQRTIPATDENIRKHTSGLRKR